jgi:hypothetical protein
MHRSREKRTMVRIDVGLITSSPVQTGLNVKRTPAGAAGQSRLDVNWWAYSAKKLS